MSLEAGPMVATIFVARCMTTFEMRSMTRGLAQVPARSSSMATAGRVLPSKNSRNAPPPVEM